jgi:predicted nucleic acid-binding protein
MRYLLDTNACIAAMRRHAANTKEFSRVPSLVLEDWQAPT